MNERIEKLAVQAKTHVLARIDEDDSDWDDQHTVLYNQKFAELIVKECMELAMTEKSRYANLYNKEADQNKYLTMLHCATSMNNYRLLLKQHFGVKE